MLARRQIQVNDGTLLYISYHETYMYIDNIDHAENNVRNVFKSPDTQKAELTTQDRDRKKSCHSKNIGSYVRGFL